MKFKLDENLPAELVADLRDLGHDGDTVSDEGLRGAQDRVVVDVAFAADRILFTLDKGIANLRRYPTNQHAGLGWFCFAPRHREEGLSSRLCASGYAMCSKWT